MSSEIITERDYRPGRNRRSRSRKRCSGGFLLPLLILLVLCGGIYAGYRNYGDLLKDRYSLSERTAQLLRSESPSRQLDPFGKDIAVVAGADNGDATLQGKSALLVESGRSESVFAKNALQRMDPASLTKIMTCLVALEHIDPAEVWTAGSEIHVSEQNASMAGIREGDRLTGEQVLYGLMLKSGADAANMVALHAAGGEEAFVALMNQKAASLGCLGTHFTNTHGLTDAQHYTTAYDVYLILRAAAQNEEFRKIAGTAVYQAEYTGASGKTVSKKWENTNYFLNGNAELAEGFSLIAGKTGTTIAAGACLALVTQYNGGPELYSVVMNSVNHDSLYPDMNTLLEKITKVD